MAPAGGSMDSIADFDPVVDVDFRVSDDASDLEPHLPDPFDELLRYPEDRTTGYFADEERVSGVFETGRVVSETDPASSPSTAEAVRERMAERHVDRALLTPTKARALSTVFNDELAAAVAAAYNDMVLSRFGDEDGLFSPIVVAPQRPDRAVEEIDDRVDERVFRAVLLPGVSAVPLFGDRRYWPIYEVAAEHDLPVVVHSTAAAMSYHFPRIFGGMTHPLELQAFANPVVQMNHLASLLMAGVPEVFDLDFVFPDAGAGYVAFMMRRLDHEYAGMEEDAPMLTRMPGEYVRESCYFTSQPLEGLGDPGYLESVLGLVGAEGNLLFSSAHPAFAENDQDAFFEEARRLFDADTVAEIYGRRAVELFDL